MGVKRCLAIQMYIQNKGGGGLCITVHTRFKNIFRMNRTNSIIAAYLIYSIDTNERNVIVVLFIIIRIQLQETCQVYCSYNSITKYIVCIHT